MEILRQVTRLLGAFIRYFLWPLVTGRKVEMACTVEEGLREAWRNMDQVRSGFGPALRSSARSLLLRIIQADERSRTFL